jgi:uncharacterized protein
MTMLRPPSEAERLDARRRPHGTPNLHFRWKSTLFFHWPVPIEWLRAVVPEPLSIDLHEGTAWLGIVPFTMTGVRPTFTPAVPGLSSMLEINVRTYVHYDGVPGVYFLSMDTNHSLTAWLGRSRFALPYHRARIVRLEHARRIGYASQRRIRDAELAMFSATCTIGSALPPATTHSKEFFLTERYCLYTVRDGSVRRLRIHHPTWPLKIASVHSYASSLCAPLGIPEPRERPLVHYADELAVDAWPMEKLLTQELRRSA